MAKSIPKPNKNMIRPKTVDAIFLGYISDSDANRFLVKNSEINEISNNNVIDFRDTTYFETIFLYRSRIFHQPLVVPDQPSSSLSGRVL